MTDDEQDLDPTPEDGIPNQDIVPDPEKGQTPSDSQRLNLPEGDVPDNNVLADLDDATLSLEQSKTADLVAGEAPSVPVDEPEPTIASPAPSPVNVTDLAVTTATPSTPDLGALDSATTSLEDSPTEDLDSATASLESFGAQVNAFNEAGGADNSIPNIGDDGGDGEGDAQQQLNDSDFHFKSKVSEMLIEHARRIDELTRGLEAERI